MTEQTLYLLGPGDDLAVVRYEHALTLQQLADDMPARPVKVVLLHVLHDANWKGDAEEFAGWEKFAKVEEFRLAFPSHLRDERRKLLVEKLGGRVKFLQWG